MTSLRYSGASLVVAEVKVAQRQHRRDALPARRRQRADQPPQRQRLGILEDASEATPAVELVVEEVVQRRKQPHAAADRSWTRRRPRRPSADVARRVLVVVRDAAQQPQRVVACLASYIAPRRGRARPTPAAPAEAHCRRRRRRRSPRRSPPWRPPGHRRRRRRSPPAATQRARESARATEARSRRCQSAASRTCTDERRPSASTPPRAAVRSSAAHRAAHGHRRCGIGAARVEHPASGSWGSRTYPCCEWRDEEPLVRLHHRRSRPHPRRSWIARRCPMPPPRPPPPPPRPLAGAAQRDRLRWRRQLVARVSRRPS